MIIVINLLIVALLCRLIYTSLCKFNGLSPKSKTHVEQADALLKKEKRIIDKRDKFSKSIDKKFNFIIDNKFVKLSSNYEKELKYFATRLDRTKNGCSLDYKYYLLVKVRYCVIYTLVVCVFILIKVSLFPLLLGVFIVYRLPDFRWDSEIAKKDLAICYEFNEFYSKFYYRLRNKHNFEIKLSDIANIYLPLAGPDMSMLCKKFIADCSISELHALNNLRDTYRIDVVQRMSVLVLNSINGSADSYHSLEIFKDELDLDTQVFMDEQLAKRYENIQKVIYLCYGIIFELLFIYAFNINN